MSAPSWSCVSFLGFVVVVLSRIARLTPTSAIPPDGQTDAGLVVHTSEGLAMPAGLETESLRELLLHLLWLAGIEAEVALLWRSTAKTRVLV